MTFRKPQNMVPEVYFLPGSEVVCLGRNLLTSRWHAVLALSWCKSELFLGLFNCVEYDRWYLPSHITIFLHGVIPEKTIKELPFWKPHISHNIWILSDPISAKRVTSFVCCYSALLWLKCPVVICRLEVSISWNEYNM